MNLFKMSVSGAVIIIVIVLIRWLAINWLPKKTFLFLWAIALCRLLVPFNLPSSLSAYNLVQRGTETSQIRINKAISYVPTIGPMPKGFDAFTKLVLTAALCIYWFNPLVWVMYILFNRDMELSCDESVIHFFGYTTKSAYARTLISMEENKNKLTPFCNNFSKNAIEERITAIMKTEKVTIGVALVALCLILGVGTAFATSAAATDKTLTSIPNTNFSQSDYNQLLALHFDGYQKMTVADFQNKVWTKTDTVEYMDLLERFNQDTQLYDMRYTNDTASFLFNTLIPLTSEKWQSRDFGSYTEAPANDVQGDRAMLEYQVSLVISNANRLTVEDYEQARSGVMEGLQRFIQGRSNTELQDEGAMDAAIQKEISALKNKWENPYLQINVEYSYRPLLLYENQDVPIPSSSEEEKRPYPYASKADYQSLMKLKTAHYEEQPVQTFNDMLLEWANEDFERNERINVDREWDDFEVLLTDQERRFVTLTARASGVENAALVQSLFTGRKKEDPVLGNFSLTKNVTDKNRAAWAELFYQLPYHISDETTLTVGERDYAIAGVINSIQQYWDSLDIDTVLTMNSDNMLKELKNIASDYSNELIQVTFTKDNIFLESMSEPIPST